MKNNLFHNLKGKRNHPVLNSIVLIMKVVDLFLFFSPLEDILEEIHKKIYLWLQQPKLAFQDWVHQVRSRQKVDYVHSRHLKNKKVAEIDLFLVYSKLVVKGLHSFGFELELFWLIFLLFCKISFKRVLCSN